MGRMRSWTSSTLATFAVRHRRNSLILLTTDHSDPGGLYSYKNQPNRVLFALDSLASSLLPIIGYEAEKGKAPIEGWSEGVAADDVRRWEEAGLNAINGWNDIFTQTLEKSECEGWQMVSPSFGSTMDPLSLLAIRVAQSPPCFGHTNTQRFGLKTYDESDDRSIVRDFQNMLKANSIDFGASLRLLASFEPSRADEGSYLRDFARRFVAATTNDLPSDSVSRAEEDVGNWLRVYAARAGNDAEIEAWTKEASEKKWEAARTERMRKVNPRFVLRQWVLEEVIATMDKALKEGDVPTARKALALVLDVSCTEHGHC